MATGTDVLWPPSLSSGHMSGIRHQLASRRSNGPSIRLVPSLNRHHARSRTRPSGRAQRPRMVRQWVPGGDSELRPGPRHRRRPRPSRPGAARSIAARSPEEWRQRQDSRLRDQLSSGQRRTKRYKQDGLRNPWTDSGSPAENRGKWSEPWPSTARNAGRTAKLRKGWPRSSRPVGP